MKNIIKILYVILILFMATSCEKYLDEPKPTDELSSTDIYSSRAGVDAYFSGIYQLFRTQYAYGDPADGGTTDVGGIYSMYFARSMKGNDVIQKQSWFMWDYDHTNREPTYRRVSVTWQYLYEMVKHANTIIREVAASELGDVDKAELTAQAKALRAFLYFQLGLDYQIYYNPTADAPPIYNENDVDFKGMSTMQELFTFILADLNAAIPDIPTNRLGKSYINLNVANGFKARVLMYMGQDWDQVQIAANAAYGGNTSAVLDAANYGSGFDDIENAEWIWGHDQQEDQSNYYYCAPHSFTDHDAVYTATFFNTNFVSMFSATDVRNTFQNIYGGSSTDWFQYVTTKFTFTFEADIPLMRTPEMILIEAEAMYHQGNEAGAHDLLFELQSNRDVNAVLSTNTGNDLFEEILIERRKELYAEMGVEWFDAKRLNRGIVRDGNHRVFIDLDANDIRFMLKIPQAEIDANDLIDESVNSNR